MVLMEGRDTEVQAIVRVIDEQFGGVCKSSSIEIITNLLAAGRCDQRGLN